MSFGVLAFSGPVAVAPSYQILSSVSPIRQGNTGVTSPLPNLSVYLDYRPTTWDVAIGLQVFDHRKYFSTQPRENFVQDAMALLEQQVASATLQVDTHDVSQLTSLGQYSYARGLHFFVDPSLSDIDKVELLHYQVSLYNYFFSQQAPATFNNPQFYKAYMDDVSQVVTTQAKLKASENPSRAFRELDPPSEDGGDEGDDEESEWKKTYQSFLDALQNKFVASLKSNDSDYPRLLDYCKLALDGFENKPVDPYSNTFGHLLNGLNALFAINNGDNFCPSGKRLVLPPGAHQNLESLCADVLAAGGDMVAINGIVRAIYLSMMRAGHGMENLILMAQNPAHYNLVNLVRFFDIENLKKIFNEELCK